jgi:peptidoglycan/LPS O-acetylase OafA/YrhL
VTTPLEKIVRPRPDGSQPPRLVQMPALDGIRGIALATVVWHHMGLVYAHKRHAPALLRHSTQELALDVFFVLSGALITALLLVEYERTDTISLRSFYERRVRRIAPALLLTVVVSVALSLVGYHANQFLGPHPWLTVVFVLLWLGNWLAAFSTGSLGWLSATWSLAVEEQFYLTWPWLLRRLLRRGVTTRRLLTILGAAVVACYVYTVIAMQFMNVNKLYFTSPTVGIGLPVGCAIGVLVVKESEHAVTRQCARTATGLLGCAGVVVVALLWAADRHALNYGLRLVFDVFVAMLVAHIFVRAAEPSWLMRALSWKPIVGLGIISYAVYLFHLPLIFSLSTVATATPVVQQMIIEAILLVAFGTASYYVLEKPIRRYGLRGALKNLFTPPQPVSDPPPSARPGQGE